MLTIDMHAHLLPRTLPDLAGKFGVPAFPGLTTEGDETWIVRNGRRFRRIWPNCFDHRMRIDEYAGHGVDAQVASTVPVMFCYWAEGRQCLELARFLNDDLAAAVASHPRHFIGLGTLPLQSPELAIAEARRCREIGLAGVQIGSHVNHWNLDAPELFPVFEALSDLGLAVLVHPWEMMGSDTMPDYWLPWLVGMPAEQSRAICSMIFGGVLERLPALRVCFAHGGGSFPFTLGRIEHGFRMRPDLVATRNQRSPREYLDRMYIDSVLHDTQAFSYVLELFGAERIMLGTDYPFPLGEQRPGSVFAPLDLTDQQRERLNHGTALEWLGLDAEQFA